MKFYVSGKIGDIWITEDVIKALKEAGHEITLDWTKLGSLKPYDTNVEACREAAIDEVNGVREADVLILIPSSRGIGMYVEFGVAIGYGVPIRVITKYASKSMFFHHPLVKKVRSVEEVIEEFSTNIGKGE